MARHIFSVLCRRSITDQGSNLLSIIDVLDSIVVEPRHAEATATENGLPPLALDGSFVSLYTRSKSGKAEHFDARVLLTGPDGQKLGETRSRIDLSKFHNYRMTSKLEQMPFVGPGLYEFKVQLQEGARWRTVASIPLIVAVKAESQPPTGD